MVTIAVLPLVEARPTPVPAPTRVRHRPALDGVRGAAVIAVLLFHGGWSWARGGWLGVSTFFTLSGFLITSLLVREWDGAHHIDLRAFWTRRFRRLLPAALATLAVICVLAAVTAPVDQLRGFRTDIWAAVGYVANWRFVFSHRSYADLFTAPSPVQHFWSLAVEEQFYLLYPIVTVAVLWAGGRRLLKWVLAVAVVASTGWAWHLRGELDRVYYGTDTRAAELLVGALLALWWTGRADHDALDREDPTAGRVAQIGGLVAIGACLALWVAVPETSPWVARGLLPVQALLSALVIAAALHRGVVSSVLGWRPLAVVGRASYGIYLYHWPVFLLLTPAHTNLGGWSLFAVRVTVTALVAAVSYRWLEQPIRSRRALSDGGAWRWAVAGALAVTVAAVALTSDLPPSTVAYGSVRLGGHHATIQSSLAAARTDETTETSIPQPSTTTSTVAAPTPATPPVAAPPAVMIVGDSGMFDVSVALGALYEHVGTATVVNASWPGFGFTRDPAGWKREWPGLVAQHRPTLVFVMLGGWDYGWVQAHGVDAYEAVLADADQVLSAAGAHVLWLGVPPGGHAQPSLIDPLFQRFVADHPQQSAYADPTPVLLNSSGQPSRWLADDAGRPVLARKPDGWHFCADGAIPVARLAAARAADLGWGPAPTGGWEAGPWRNDARFNDPKGGCDPALPANAPQPG